MGNFNVVIDEKFVVKHKKSDTVKIAIFNCFYLKDCNLSNIIGKFDSETWYISEVVEDSDGALISVGDLKEYPTKEIAIESLK